MQAPVRLVKIHLSPWELFARGKDKEIERGDGGVERDRQTDKRGKREGRGKERQKKRFDQHSITRPPHFICQRVRIYPGILFRFIKAATFLEGFHEPALAILFEPIQTYAGRLASMRSTCRLVLLSVNLTQVKMKCYRGVA